MQPFVFSVKHSPKSSYLQIHTYLRLSVFYLRAVPFPVNSDVVIDNKLPEAVDDVPHGVVDGPAVQHHHVERYVASEEQDLISQLLVHVDPGRVVL